MLNLVTDGLIPEVNSDVILNGFSLSDDFTMNFCLNETGKNEGNFMQLPGVYIILQEVIN